MRALALLLGLALVVAAPAEAKRGPKPLRSAAEGARGAKPLRFAAKRAEAGVKGARGWRATPLAVVVPAGAPAPTPAPATTPAPPPPPATDAPVLPSGEPAPPPPPAPLCDPSPWLGAIAEDADGFRLRLTRTCVPAGTVLLQLRNRDLAEHNLWGEGVAPAAPKRQLVPGTPGETVATASVTLTAGTWRLYCSLPGHEAMTRLVDVTPAG